MKFTTMEICENVNVVEDFTFFIHVVEDVPILCRNISKYYSDKTIKPARLNSTERKRQHRDYGKGF